MTHEHIFVKSRKKRGHTRIPKDKYKHIEVTRIEQMGNDMTDTFRNPDRDQFLGFCEPCGWVQITQKEYEELQ